MIKGPAKVWFGQLKPGSISNFTVLSRQFVGYFIGRHRHRKPATHLLNIKQNKGESLLDYMSQFNKETLQVYNANERIIVATLTVGLMPSKFLFSLSKNPPTWMADLMVKVQQHMNAEDTLNARQEQDVGSNP